MSREIKYVTVQLSAAQLISLSGGVDQIELIPAPGVGKAIVPFVWSINYVFGGTPFTIGGSNQAAIVLGFPMVIPKFMIAGDILQGLLDQVVNMTYCNVVGGSQSPSYQSVNQPIVAQLSDTPGNTPSLSSGTGSVSITIWYFITEAQ